MKWRTAKTILIIIAFIITQGNFVFAALKDDIAGLNDQILEKKKQIQDLETKISDYQKKINQEQSKSASLANSIALTKNKIAQIELKINKLNLDIDTSNLEIKVLESNIGDKQTEINNQKISLGTIIRSFDRLDRESAIRILIFNPSFSAFYNQVKYLEEVQVNLLTILNKLKNQRIVLEEQNKNLTIKKNILLDQKQQLQDQTTILQEQKSAQNILMRASINKQNQFKEIVSELRDEQKQVNDAIASISNAIKEKIRKSDQYKIGEAVILSWPVDPKKGISTYFHDPEYPFRYVYEHPGIDIRVAQGTKVFAAAPGYVVTARDAGMGYSYIILIHFDNSITVYGHVSRIDVKKDQFVERGQMIGLSGGTPGTRGAGRLTTGPHLHFEVRKNNTSVNPLDYLMDIN